MPIGRKVGSMKSMRDSLKKGSSGTFIKYVPKDGSMVVRFLEEPENWINYVEHWDDALRKSYPCIEDNCPGCMTEERRSSRYLANALDVENDRVVPLQMPKTLVSALVAMYDRLDTLLDRDFELIRSGDGLDTQYNCIPEPPTPRKLNKYTLHDLQEVLDGAYKAAFNTDASDDEDEKAPAKPKGVRKASKAAATAKGAAQPDVEDDTDDEDEDEAPAPKKAAAKKKAAPKLKKPDVEPEEDDEDVPVPSDEVEDDDDDDDEDENEEGFLTEEQLHAMSLGELRATARDYGINTKGLNKLDLIEAILTPEED